MGKLGKCDNCIKRINESCYLLGEHSDCMDFVAAQPKLHKAPRPRSRPEAGPRDPTVSRYSFEELKDKIYRPDTTAASGTITAAQKLPFGLYVGKVLYYADRETGTVEPGRITDGDSNQFTFQTEIWTLEYAYTLIGRDFFHTDRRARQELQKSTSVKSDTLSASDLERVAGGVSPETESVK